MKAALIFACLLLSIHAARVSQKRISKVSRHASEAKATEGSSLSPQVMHMIENALINECSFMLVNDYAKIIGDERVKSAKAQALVKLQENYPEDWPLIEKAKVLKMQVIDVNKFSNCAVGAPLLACYDQLEPMELLQQRWLLETFHEGDGGHGGIASWFASDDKEYPVPEEQFVAMHELFRQSLKAMKFSASRAKIHCWSKSKKPLPRSVRGCLIEKANGNKTREDMLTQKFELEDHKTTYLAMSNRWYDFARRSRWKAKEEFKGFEEGIERLNIQLYGSANGAEEAVEECEKDADPSKMVIAKARIHDELHATCNEETDCHEKFGQVSPSGYACDYQKEYTPERAVVGIVLGDIASMGFYPAIGFTLSIASGGTMAVAQAAALQWALIPNFPWDAIFASMFASALSRSIFSSCMAFPLSCDRNPQSGVCEMRSGTDTTRASSNPFARLPMEGFKCAPMHAANASGPSECQLQICSREEVKEKGPGQLFGRAGVIDKGTYNCANTKGTPQSFLGNLEKVPDPSFAGEVANSVEARNALLALYPHVTGIPALKSATEEPVPPCTAAAMEEIKKTYRIVDTHENGRFSVTCPNEVATDSNQYEASCKRADCDGYTWCLTDCSMFGYCSPLPPVTCK